MLRSRARAPSNDFISLISLSMPPPETDLFRVSPSVKLVWMTSAQSRVDVGKPVGN